MAIPANEARTRRARRLTAAVAPVLCGAAAAGAVIGTPAASLAGTTQAQESHAATAPAKATGQNATVRATGQKAVAEAAVQKASAKAAHIQAAYTVKPGDTLSAISRHYYGESRLWTAIYRANQHTVRYANEIQVGQQLTIPAKPAQAPPAPSDLSAPAPVHQAAQEDSGPGESVPADSGSAPATGDSAFEQCVISRESGGDSQVMNSSGHYGLYQFSSSTWAAYGGDPADFGHASSAEQKQVFDNAVADGGQSNWSAYDGCS